MTLPSPIQKCLGSVNVPAPPFPLPSATNHAHALPLPVDHGATPTPLGLPARQSLSGTPVN